MAEYKPKRYACTRWPFLRVGGGVKFNAGFYTTKSEAEEKAIEKNEAFGIHIHPILWEPTAVPSKQGKVESLIEADIQAALDIKKPQARRGAVGTGNVKG